MNTSLAPRQIDAKFPAKLEVLFQPKRYKVLWGGRAAGRSWGCARALLLIGKDRPIRVLCAREFQNSIAESVHKLLSDQISELGLEEFYEIQKQGIYGRNGTSFSFEGIKNNILRIKSYEGVDYCWVEEAAKVSKSSWNVLIPTIRKAGSEIWMTFNPELDTDYTYTTFVKEANKYRDDTIVCHMTWRDNPGDLSRVLPEISKMRESDYDLYLNVWEGQCLQLLEGAVYAKELRDAAQQKRICTVPWDRETPVQTFWDLGRADQTAIWMAQKVAMQIRILAFYQASGEEVIHYVRELQRRPYTYSDHFLPHDGKAKKLGSKMTIQEQLIQHFPNCNVNIVPKQSLTDGINAARLTLANCWFDEELCEEGLQSLRHYRYKVVDGQRSNEPLHDAASDGADAFRYLALAIKGNRHERKGVLARLAEAKGALIGKARSAGPNSQGWMS